MTGKCRVTLGIQCQPGVLSSVAQTSLPGGKKRGPPGDIEAPREKKLKMDRKVKGQCSTILNTLISHKDSWAFRKPVDPVELQIPDYFDVISSPMDLGTIKSKLDRNLYFGAGEFAADVELAKTVKNSTPKMSGKNFNRGCDSGGRQSSGSRSAKQPPSLVGSKCGTRWQHYMPMQPTTDYITPQVDCQAKSSSTSHMSKSDPESDEKARIEAEIRGQEAAAQRQAELELKERQEKKREKKLVLPLKRWRGLLCLSRIAIS
ncbi:hypothetical protein J5N97_001933 [Dioscorea zingiberensis]|uniref:Bromo domain-containing protein n=1 Tax=Dioscorea zingiberensis TaxID=325984 RepID=A0A9D5H1V0_9LILI|nr:hypothetical protein J5N97_001933 [Dioscorea zingiberensis]